MKAAVFYGERGPLKIEDVAVPRPTRGEALVKVAACGVCHTDLHYLDHGVPTFKPPPVVLGHEISGTVVAAGPGADAGIVGKAVLLAPVTTCGSCAACRSGRENVCAAQRMIGNSFD